MQILELSVNIYQELTKQFNTGKLRAIISSGQAVVLHRLAIMSKDGDWILRENSETMEYVLNILSDYQAQYRFGAPLDIRWMSGGWSAHFEFYHKQLRIRTDFITRPPRISESKLENLWKMQENQDIPFVNAQLLAEIKKTNREKDYAIIGELARLMPAISDQLLYSRSARDLISLAEKDPKLVSELKAKRPLLEKVSEGREKLEEALDAERRELMHANEKRLELYMYASQKWLEAWPHIKQEIKGFSLLKAHEVIVEKAQEILPFYPEGPRIKG